MLLRIYIFFLFALCSGCAGKEIREAKSIAGNIDRPDEGLTVVIQPFGKISRQKVQFVQNEILAFYKCKDVRVAKAVDLPEMAWYAPRRRYVADSLLVFLSKRLEQGTDKVIGLLDEDIATEKGDVKNYGVMGLGFCPGSSCVVSTHRIRIKADNEQHFLERYAKVCLHELGHTLGLPHCSGVEKCFMNDAGGTVKSVDKEEKWLCGKCRDAVKSHLK